MLSPIIKCLKKDIPADYWQNPLFYTEEPTYFDKSNNSLINKIYQDDILNTANCFFVLYRHKLLVITCFHATKDCYDYKLYLDSEIIDLVKYHDVPEYDISILTTNIELNIEEIKKAFYIIDMDTELNFNIPEINTEVDIISNKVIKSKVVNITEGNIGNEYFSHILQIELKKPQLKKLQGLSGSACYAKDKFIGVIFSNNTNINLIPAIYIELAFKIRSYKTIIIEGRTVNIYDDELNKNNYSIKLEKNITINYKNKLTDKDFSFKKDMLITNIDHQELDQHGTLYCDIINYQVSPKTYINIKNLSSVEVTGYKSIKGDYKQFTTQLEPQTMIDNLVFSSSNNVITYKDYVFMELNLEIIKQHITNKKIINLLKNPYGCNKQIVYLKKNKFDKIKFLQKLINKKFDNLIDFNSKFFDIISQISI